MRRRRARRLLKWVGTALCGLCVLAWAVGLLRPLHYVAGTHSYALGWGSIRILAHRTHVPEDARGWGLQEPDDNRPHVWLTVINHKVSVGVVVPLWMPFVTLAAPTAFLWWRDRRRIPPGHCRKCGYNLTGNVSGVCPECGVGI
ncbi:MAG: hypothetical protein ABIG44_03720 [Planctomycetota bacterium]